MKATVQVTFDCTDPHRLARFWAEALDCEEENHATFVEGLLSGQEAKTELATGFYE